MANIMHEVDFKIFGDDMQFVEIELDPQEAAVAEAGGMMYMDDGIEMETIFGDGSQQNSGFLGALMGAGKRLITGESLFMTAFQNRGYGKKRVAFGAPYPGKIIPVHLSEIGGELITQKDSFLAAAKGVSIGIAFQKRIGVGLFGGEGFIMQRLQGDGWAFVHAGGTLMQRDLAPGELIRVDTGCIVGFQPSVDYDIQFVRSVKSALFGGEGLFFATLRGPGRVWLQSLPLSRLADRIYAAAPKAGGKARGEGSILGALGGVLDGDNS
ncbi:MAG TPA: TIGR00266 family protein [Methylomirabilota bacterium]|nr:TIGR00266 family protein [Methylomirabilota bacterium]